MKSKSNSTNGAPALCGIPMIAIPRGAQLNEFEELGFSIETITGSVEVSTFRNEINCFGTAEALVAARIINMDWIAEGRKSWCVYFDDAGPHVRIGGRGRPKGKYIQIHTNFCAAGEYRVIFPVSRDNELALAKLRTEADPDISDDPYISEVVKRMNEMDSVGRAVVLNKAREMVKEHPLISSKPQCQVIQFPRA